MLSKPFDGMITDTLCIDGKMSGIDTSSRACLNTECGRRESLLENFLIRITP